MTVLRYVLVLLLGGVLSVQAQHIDSAEALIAPEYDKAGKLKRFFLGDSYRQLYNTPVRMRQIDLSKEKGGLKIVKLGGGMQTQSLRLVDPTGREWVLRSIQKYPERSLPESLRQTIVKDIVQDQISITHPFGALTVPTFNRALGILHAEPELVFVGDDPLLGEYRPIFKNRAYIFEPRMPNEESDTDNTLKVIRKLIEDNDIQTVQELTLRTRLLDMILGDWDRHEDNWRWDPVKAKGKRTYTAVPRDRDKVFYKTSGVFPVLLSKQWLKAHLQPFSPHINNVSHWNFNARHFDRFFLNQLNQKDWEKEIAFVQQQMTDSLIRSAINEMPDTIVQLSGDELYQFMRSRRDELHITGLEYYKALASIVDIPLSAKNEFIDIDYKDNGNIALKVNNKKKDGTEGRRLVKRTFKPEDTKEIRIYGIDGSDTYTVHGKGSSPIKVRLIGGKGTNDYSVDSAFTNGRKLYLYDAKNKKDEIFAKKASIRYRLSKDKAVHAYDYHNFMYDRKGILLDVNYGTDKGLNLGLGYVIERQGFRKDPFAYRHILKGNYLTGRKSFSFDYEGIAKSIWHKQDLRIHIDADGPRNLSNFFGYGNETIYDKSEGYGISYYRNRYDKVDAHVSLHYPLSRQLHVEYGSISSYFYSNEKNNIGKFLNEFQLDNPKETVYGKHLFTGLKLGIDYDSRDNSENTKRGIHAYMNIRWQAELAGEQRQYSKLSSALSFYKTIGGESLTLANRTGLDAVWGNPYFYQYAQLGGEGSLRGFNSQRFTGNTMLYNNLEARAKLFSFDSYLVPATIGLVGFYDIGRVWMKGEKSKRWHQGYGAGFYFIPADLMFIQATWGISKEAVLPYLRLGVSF